MARTYELEPTSCKTQHSHLAPSLVQVKQQVESQMCAACPLPPFKCFLILTHPSLCVSSKVRDLSHTSVSIAPADYASWHDVRTELMSEAKAGFKARVEAELAAAGGENLDELKAAFQQEERAIEHQIDHTVHTFSASVDVSYNFLSH